MGHKFCTEPSVKSLYSLGRGDFGKWFSTAIFMGKWFLCGFADYDEADVYDARLKTAHGGTKEMHFPGWSRPQLLQQWCLLIIRLHETMPHAKSFQAMQVHSAFLRTGKRKLSTMCFEWFYLLESVSREHNRYKRLFALSVELLEHGLREWKVHKEVSKSGCLLSIRIVSILLVDEFHLQLDAFIQ